MLLKITNLQINYEKIAAVKSINLKFKVGEIVTLIGANGAGKSSVLRSISGLVKPASGNIIFEGESIGCKPSHDIVKRGIAHVPEGRRLFKLMTVEENLIMGGYLEKSHQKVSENIKNVYSKFPILREKRYQRAGELSGGQQQMVAMGRALMTNPKLILMDEPSLGLAPVIIEDISNLILELRNTGISILLVEQNANLALTLASYGYVMEMGKIVIEGSAKSLIHNPKVVKAYLGN